MFKNQVITDTGASPHPDSLRTAQQIVMECASASAELTRLFKQDAARANTRIEMTKSHADRAGLSWDPDAAERASTTVFEFDQHLVNTMSNNPGVAQWSQSTIRRSLNADALVFDYLIERYRTELKKG